MELAQPATMSTTCGHTTAMPLPSAVGSRLKQKLKARQNDQKYTPG